jgi:DNA-binding NarL/FixJ family response regulator
MRILLADDQRLMRDGIRPFLAKLAAKSVFFEAASFDEAIAMAKGEGGVDLAVLGQTMPGMNGAFGLQEFADLFPSSRVVLLANAADPKTILAAVAAGAHGVIPKTISGQGMLGALRLVVAGEVYLPSDAIVALAELAILAESDRSAPLVIDLAEISFSAAETEVVPLLLDGLPNKCIAQRLDINEAAVKARLRSVYKKISVTNRAQAVWELLRLGKVRSV